MNERQEIVLIEELLPAVVPFGQPPVVFPILAVDMELDVTDDDTVGGLDAETAVDADMGELVGPAAAMVEGPAAVAAVAAVVAAAVAAAAVADAVAVAAAVAAVVAAVAAAVADAVAVAVVGEAGAAADVNTAEADCAWVVGAVV